MNNLFESRIVNHTPHSFPTSLDNLPSTFRGTYVQIRDKWMYTARISEIIEMLKFIYGIEEWDILDPREINNGEIESWLMDKLVDFRNKKQLDFGKIWEKIKDTLEFSNQELSLIETGSIDERLWAIFTVLTNPNLEIKY